MTMTTNCHCETKPKQSCIDVKKIAALPSVARNDAPHLSLRGEAEAILH